MSTTIVSAGGRGGLVTLLRRWLGLEARDAAFLDLEQLVDGQRRDFDQLGQTLAVKDAEHAATDRNVRDHERLLGEAIGQLNRVTAGLSSVHDRLTHYEHTVPQIAGAKKAYDARMRREVKRREALIAAHPELSEAGKQWVKRTGELPSALAVPEGVPEPAPVQDQPAS